jgi:diguanylate cyclase (GGDEF)-like protein
MRRFLRGIFGDMVTDLGSLEGDYRFAQLKSDITQSILYMTVVGISMLVNLVADVRLFENHPKLLGWMIVYRAGYAAVTALFGAVIYRTARVRDFDRLMFIWILVTVLFRLLLNFTRPADYLTTSFDIIIPLAIYMLSPLRLRHTVALALIFSVGTLYIYHTFKTGVDPVVLSVAILAQCVVHMLGLVTVTQVQTYRRKSFKAYIDEKDAREMVAYLANIDPLTRSLTRRQLLNIAESEFRRFQRYHRPFSVLILDVDRFKTVNDTYGHHAGDLALRSLSLVAMEQKRAQDTFGRLGGEEFGLLLPETNLEKALVVAERIRKAWEDSPVKFDEELIRSTISIGVAEAAPADGSLEELLRRADRMLYKAKEAGRNRVES